MKLLVWLACCIMSIVLGGSTAGVLVTATKRSIAHNGETRDRVAAARLEYRNGTMLGRTHAISGCAANLLARSGGRALEQERCPQLRFSDVSVARARGW